MQNALGIGFLVGLVFVGCATSESPTLEGLHEAATEVSGLAAQSGPFIRQGWEFDGSSVTAHYRSRHGIALALATILYCSPEERPQNYIQPNVLLGNLQRRYPKVEEVSRGTITFAGRRIPFVRFRRQSPDGERVGAVAGAVLALGQDSRVLLLHTDSNLQEAEPEKMLQPFFEQLVPHGE